MSGLSAYRITYTNAIYGTVVDLDDPDLGLTLLGPMLGIGMPPVDHSSEATFDFPGDVHTHTRFGRRDITIATAIIGPNEAAILERLRAVATALRPVNHPRAGYLTFTHESLGNPRRIWCQYAGGMQTEMSAYREDHETWVQPYGLVFRCFDPFFEDVQEAPYDFRTSGSVSTPFFPLFANPANVGPHLGSSTIFETREITNPGDDQAYPIWEITGPASALIIENTSTQQTMDFSRSGGIPIAEGVTALIDTTPEVRAVTYAGTENGLPFLTDESELWAFPIGTSQVFVQAVDSSSSTLIRLRMRHRRLTL